MARGVAGSFIERSLTPHARSHRPRLVESRSFFGLLRSRVIGYKHIYVAPFIIRGVTLIGIDSVLCPMTERLIAWDRLVHTLDINKISEITHSRPLSEAMSTAEEVLAGKIRGRVVIDVLY